MKWEYIIPLSFILLIVSFWNRNDFSDGMGKNRRHHPRVFDCIAGMFDQSSLYYGFGVLPVSLSAGFHQRGVCSRHFICRLSFRRGAPDFKQRHNTYIGSFGRGLAPCLVENCISESLHGSGLRRFDHRSKPFQQHGTPSPDSECLGFHHPDHCINAARF